MAKLVPSTLPEGTTFGERRVFDALSRLPDDCIVYYEPRIAGRTPDFIVIMPSLGVLVIEVKDWLASTVQQADSNQVTLKLDTEESSKKVKHPGRQASEYMYRLMSQAEGHSQSRALLSDDKRFKGQFLFPFAQLVIFTRITSSPKSAIGNWDEVFLPDQTLYSSDLNAWAELSAHDLLAAVKERLKPWWKFNSLTQRQVDTLRSIVHPELVIPTLPLQFQTEDELRILDLHQERQARQIGRGHRILYGIAGSGKTVLLVARAKFLVQVPNYEVLILCRNRPLARHLHATTQHKQIESRTFHSWGQSLGLSWQDYPDGDAYGENLLQKLDELPNRKRYDAVLVDEGQDFHASWFTCAKAAMKDPDDGNLLIVLDAAQSLYRRKGYTWSSVGISAQGRTLSKNFGLDQNYRNTKEILAAAAPFCFSADGDENTPDVALEVDSSLAVRSGPKPLLVRQENAQAECDVVVSRVSELVSGKQVNPSSIAILYQGVPQFRKPIYDDMIASLRMFTQVLEVKSSEVWDIASTGIRVMNIHQSKGLQFQHVFLIWVDVLRGQDEDAQRRVLYVGLTRAEETLYLSHHRQSKFSAMLEPHCEVMSGAG